MNSNERQGLTEQNDPHITIHTSTPIPTPLHPVHLFEVFERRCFVNRTILTDADDAREAKRVPG